MSRHERGDKHPSTESAPPASVSVEHQPGSSRPEARWVRLKVTAELTEDAHPGSGAGDSGLDALVARDRDGRPVIWASHLKGLLRDAAHRLWGGATADELFGRRGSDRQQISCTSLYTTVNPTSRVWRSAARVSFDNRAPKDDTLRAVEYVPRGTRFEGQVEVRAGEIGRLRRLLCEVEAVGHGRATGAGRVQLTLAETTQARRPIGHPTGRLLLLLRNRDPLCITATATPGNLVPSLPFIPGRTLLGALAEWLIQAEDRDTASLLVGTRVFVSDALPLPATNEPTQLSEVTVLPAPLSLRSKKPEGGANPLPWWALPTQPVHRCDVREVTEEERGQLKRPELDLFVCGHGPQAQWETYRPFLRVRLRNGRPEGPGQSDPSLFAVEEIAENTLFLCELRGDLADIVRVSSALQPVLEGSRWLHVGRGGAPVEVVRFEWSNPPPPPAVGHDAYLILTSELLIRDSHLRWMTALDDEGFQQIPGWPQGVRVTPVAQDTVPVHGFNGTSRLWRLPAFAVRRGSVFLVGGDGFSALVQAAADGRWLGERTHEGFGRFRLDETLPGVTVEDSEPEESQLPQGPVADDSAEKIAVITRGWFESHQRLAEAGSALNSRPSLSQWQSLVTEIEQKDAGALPSRLQPTTAGKRVWRDQDAQEILKKLEGVGSQEERVAHARMFVRWLRAAMRRRKA